MGTPAPVHPPPQRRQQTACPPVANQCLQPHGAPSGHAGQVAPNVSAVIQGERFTGGKQLPRAFPSAPSLPIAWNGDFSSSSTGGGDGEAELEEDNENREDGSLLGLLFQVHHPLSLGTEPWGAPSGHAGQVAPNVSAVIQGERFTGGKQLPRAFPSAPSLPIAWNGDFSSSSTGGGDGEAELEEDNENREDGSLLGLLFQVHHPLSLGTEPWVRTQPPL
ncbi:UNVERIFIED_CONTAM: hypothetical protein FKN15_048322 [Acipenser sinensis]